MPADRVVRAAAVVSEATLAHVPAAGAVCRYDQAPVCPASASVAPVAVTLLSVSPAGVVKLKLTLWSAGVGGSHAAPPRPGGRPIALTAAGINPFFSWRCAGRRARCGRACRSPPRMIQCMWRRIVRVYS